MRSSDPRSSQPASGGRRNSQPASGGSGGAMIGVLFKMFKALGSPSKKEWPRLHGLPRYREGLFPNFHGGLDSKWGLRIGPQYNALLQGVVRVTPERRWSAEASRIFCIWPIASGIAD